MRLKNQVLNSSRPSLAISRSITSSTGCTPASSASWAMERPFSSLYSGESPVPSG